MILAEAEAILARILAPLSPDAFFDSVGRRWREARGSPGHPRARLFGADPERTMLDAFATHAATLDCHALAPTGPRPAARPVEDAAAFRRLIGSFHANGYSVRVPDVVPLAGDLQLFARALEFLFHQPVTASLFWSRAGARARIHHDDEDNIVVHLSGRKRWFISDDPPRLQNEWKRPADLPPLLERHQTRDLAPGDLLYLPRGTAHSVETLEDSLHLAILFKPITVRDVLIAAVDHMSDLDRPLRETAIARADDIARPALGLLAPKVAEQLARLAEQARSPAFLREAMERRSSRVISRLAPSPADPTPPSITPDTVVRHHSLAIAHLTPSARAIDLSQPGGHSHLHPGAEPALRFICGTPRFRARDLPGGLAPEVQVLLTQSLLKSGFLQLEAADARSSEPPDDDLRAPWPSSARG